MNDEIKQLRKQALDWVQHNLETVERDHAVMEHEQLEMVNEKFAELIVKECADVCLSGKNKENWRCTDSINKGFSDAVLEHFGVAE